MSDQPKFINADGEVFQATDAADAASMRRAGVTEADPKAIKADLIQKQYSASWTEHPVLAAFNTLEAGALGVAKGIPGAMTAARGYTQLYDAVTGQYGAEGSVTQNFDDYTNAEAENHPVMNVGGQVLGMAAAGSVPGTLVANTTKNVVAAGATQGFGYALDQAASEHLLAPDGAEKAGALTAQLVLGGLLGAAGAKFADAALGGGLLRGSIAEAGASLGQAARKSLGQMTAAELKLYTTELVSQNIAQGMTRQEARTAAEVAAKAAVKPATNAVTEAAGFVSRNAGRAAMGLGAAGIPGAAGPAAVISGAAKVVKAVANPQNISRVVAGLGAAMQGFDAGLAKVVAVGLGEEHVVGAFTGLLTHVAYDQVSQRLASMGNKPADLVPSLAMAHAEAGTDPRVADVAVQQQARAVSYLADQRPKPQFGMADSVAPVQQSVSLRQKAEFIDKVNAVQNPTWALANPNPARMAAVMAVYPVLHNAVTSLVSQHAATLPGMSLAQRQWAGQVTGRAATPMGNPRIQAILALQGQIEQAKKQPAKSGTGSAGAATAMVDSTQAERLAR